MLLWIFIGVIFLIAEILTTSFFIVFFGLAAFTIAAVSSIWFIQLPIQIGGFAVLALLYVLVFRKFFRKKKHKPITDFSDTSLIGETGLIQEDVPSSGYGKVLVRDTYWRAVSNQNLGKGTKVKIINQQNLTLEVRVL
ncbi:hypothetical protein COB11_00775 [Candidatus Aerophobetes bacterium]|uniref:NfeD-like C-terminal domain-containing protein n=1 Tax=Aerophobetes bacterium TaxID=2030807 RepID=A0A2A4YNT2_UNCAE|nr:MAG: hypothetical protein COB11_00775 [Candidatus Aerophobetes bacterium]